MGEGTRGELVAHAAQVVAAPPKRSANTPSTWSRADEATFLQGIDDDGYRNAMRDIIAGCIPLGLTLEWGSRGASIRLSTPDRSEPLSIGWVLPEGAHWSGARNASFGVDPASLAATPSVAQAVTRYVDEIGKISGASAVPTKSLRAFTLGPNALPVAHARILEALAQLVADVNGSRDE